MIVEEQVVSNEKEKTTTKTTSEQLEGSGGGGGGGDEMGNKRGSKKKRKSEKRKSNGGNIKIEQPEEEPGERLDDELELLAKKALARSRKNAKKKTVNLNGHHSIAREKAKQKKKSKKYDSDELFLLENNGTQSDEHSDAYFSEDDILQCIIEI